MNWVKASDKLPPEGDLVVVLVSGQPCENITLKDVYQLGEYYPDEGWIIDAWPRWTGPQVSYWLPLPTPPKGV